MEVDFAAVGCGVGVVPVCGVAVGVWAAIVGVGVRERTRVAVAATVAGVWLGGRLPAVPLGVAAAV
jgi:hypothetical protein